MQRSLSEQKVLKKLDISDFRHMTKDKVVEFASMLPRMDPEVAKKALEQFPEYTAMASKMVATYKNIIDKMLESNAKDVQAFYDACNSILASQQKQLDKDSLVAEERKQLNDNMIVVANMIGEKVSENKRFWLNILGITAQVFLGIGVLAAAILGVRKIDT